jgi:hypothetical protein
MTSPTTSVSGSLVSRHAADALESEPVEKGGIGGAFSRARKTFDEGESLWIPAMILAIGYGVVVPIFLLMVALDYAAYYLAGGK